MSYRLDLHSLDDVAARLPFHLDSSAEVNEAYSIYLRSPSPEAARLVDLWTYCFIRRYYLIKFLKEHSFQAGELESVVEQTYRKVEKGRMLLKQNDRYAQWVSVVCKNNFINFVTRRSLVTTVDDVELLDDLDVLQSEEAESSEWSDLEVDAGILYVALARAIEKLPSFLRNVTRMRFVEQLSYEEIGRMTGLSVATVRAYIHKACTRFREDPVLGAFKSWYR